MTFFTDKTTTNEAGGSQSATPVRMDLVPSETLLRVAEVLASGAVKYGEGNWKLIDTSDHINHALAHLYGHLSGDTSEQHLLNAICRCMFAATTDTSSHTVEENPFITKVKDFNKIYGLKTESYQESDCAVDDLLVGLIEEELQELREAMCDNTPKTPSDMSIEPIQDALGDLLYVVLGAAIRWGFDIEGIFNEVHRSNLSKLGKDGKPIYREDGKLLKGPNYTPPQLGSQYCL
jgi:predicted HAD superfamily Cof-like phosphohydrolase